MKLDELKKVWQQQENRQAGDYTKAELDELIHTKMSSLRQQIRRRDRLEIAACILVIIFFGYVFQVSQTHWTRLGAAIIVISSIYIIYMLKSAQMGEDESPDSVNMPVEKHLQKELERVEQQRKLLSNIAWWYIAPPITGLFFITLGWDTALLYKTIYMILVLALGVGVWLYNQRALLKKFDPLKQELVEAIKFIEKEEE